jgi:hypothetical protein
LQSDDSGEVGGQQISMEDKKVGAKQKYLFPSCQKSKRRKKLKMYTESI